MGSGPMWPLNNFDLEERQMSACMKHLTLPEAAPVELTEAEFDEVTGGLETATYSVTTTGALVTSNVTIDITPSSSSLSATIIVAGSGSSVNLSATTLSSAT
jgi:hypothetical protein